MKNKKIIVIAAWILSVIALILQIYNILRVWA